MVHRGPIKVKIKIILFCIIIGYMYAKNIKQTINIKGHIIYFRYYCYFVKQCIVTNDCGIVSGFD